MTARPRIARALLAVDAAGCAGSAVAVLASGRLVDLVAPEPRVRPLLAAALATTGAVLAIGAVPREPSRSALTGAAVVNLGWTAACVVAYRSRPTVWGRRLTLATAMLDAGAAAGQLALGR